MLSAFVSKRSAGLIFFLIFFLNSFLFCDVKTEPSYDEDNQVLSEDDSAILSKKNQSDKKVIRKIIVSGNRYIKEEVILNKLPYQSGLIFDESKSEDAINAIYGLGYFKQVVIEVEDIDDYTLDLYVTLEEKPLLETVVYNGNKSIKCKRFNEKLNTENTYAVDEEFIGRGVKIISELYREEGFYNALVSGQLVLSEDGSKATVIFNIDEGVRSKVTRIKFEGNHFMPSRKLTNIMIIREEWIGSILTKDGRFNDEMLDMDKMRIEHYYREYGFLNARVVNTEVIFSEDKTEIHLKFTVQEGDQYIVRNISAPGDDIFLEEDLLPYIVLEKNRPYVQSKLGISIEKLKKLWGQKGYINADVYPRVEPDEVTKTVDVTFLADRGNQVMVGRINITGNYLTRDKVIRRKIDIQEGDLITSEKLQKSQDRVEALSIFEQGGVNWKMHRITDKISDLELNVKETKTGHLNISASYGSDQDTDANKRAVRLGVSLAQSNFMGYGTEIGLNAQIQLAKKGSQVFEAHYDDPHLFDTNINGRVMLYHSKEQFDEWRNVNHTPTVVESGGSIGLGTFITQIDKNLAFNFEAGFEYVQSKRVLALKQKKLSETVALQQILDNDFKTNPLQWFTLSLGKDTRNHNIYPNKGYKIYWFNKLALPFTNDHYAFIKSELDASYYVRLIGIDTLVLMLHGKAGLVHELGEHHHIPYKELYNMGGQLSVRGFRFGQIGPSWNNQDPLGSRYALQFNTELIFPLVQDYGMKGYLFYDAGAGWDTPLNGVINRSLVTRNNFNVRHSVGFGLNLMKPYPAKLAWGYKLDRNKKTGESSHEFHLLMNMAW